ncbi:MAG: zinc-ribbon domain-containing protein [Deltaproteobacteria bacterium]|nr:zinc-ribbon domain-containing protein [Deltaproteobacteria bacterium]
MNVLCPNCGTEFNIPDQIYKAGRKARCAVCACIFLLPDIPEPDAAWDEQPAPEVSEPPRPPLPEGPPEPSPPAYATARDTAFQTRPAAVQTEASATRQLSGEQLPPPEPQPAHAPMPQPMPAPQQEAVRELPQTPSRQMPSQGAPVFKSDNPDLDAFVNDSAVAPAAQAPPAPPPDQSSLPVDFAEFDEFIKSVDQDAAAPATPHVPEKPQISPQAQNAQNAQNTVDDWSNEQAQGPVGQASFEREMEAVLSHAAPGAGLEELEEKDTASPKRSKKKFVLLGLALLFIAGAGIGAYSLFFSGQDADEELPVKTVDIPPETLAKVNKMDIRTSGIKYDYIRNKKLGPILVLEGRVTNYFETPKDYITVEARLLNSKGEVIKTRKQVCGVVLTPLQLSDLGQRELDRALSNRIEIMANNVNVMPGADVPFMVVIVYPPSDAVELEVSVVDAADPPAAGSRGTGN